MRCRPILLRGGSPMINRFIYVIDPLSKTVGHAFA